MTKTKAIIIIVGALILFALLVAVVFDLFPSRRQKEEQVSQEEVILPQKDESLPQGAQFDESNSSELAQLDPYASGGPIEGPLEREAEDIAQFFIERFATYSSDARFANIDDLAGFMTERMRQDMNDYKKETPSRDGYYAVDSTIVSFETKEFSLPSRRASYEIVLSRREESVESPGDYNQEVAAFLLQDKGGQWKIDKVVWGRKL